MNPERVWHAAYGSSPWLYDYGVIFSIGGSGAVKKVAGHAKATDYTLPLFNPAEFEIRNMIVLT